MSLAEFLMSPLISFSFSSSFFNNSLFLSKAFDSFSICFNILKFSLYCSLSSFDSLFVFFLAFFKSDTASFNLAFNSFFSCFDSNNCSFNAFFSFKASLSDLAVFEAVSLFDFNASFAFCFNSSFFNSIFLFSSSNF